MCYSKEVSLAVGITMAAVTAYSWRRFAAVEPAALSASAPPRLPSSPPPVPLHAGTRSILTAHFCLAGHQVFEAAAIQFGSEIIYKIGLFVSLSCMLFLMRSLEQLTRTRFSRGVYGLVFAAVAVHIFTRDTVFSNRHFWVRGEDHIVWGVAWIFLFFYWNWSVRHAIADRELREDRRALRLYAWGVLNVSFVLSLLYAFLAIMTHDIAWARGLWRYVGLGVPTDGYYIFYDLPSIWCVFSGMQVVLTPFVLRQLHRSLSIDSASAERGLRVPERLSIFTKTAVLTALLYFASPVLREVGLKMFTK